MLQFAAKKGAGEGMSAIRIPRVQAMMVLRPMSGRTMPRVILCRDGEGNDREAVMKWRAGLAMKETGLVCELMAECEA